MEVIAAVGLLSSIVQLVDFTSKVSKRLNDFSREVEISWGFTKDIQNQLPLILRCLERIQGDIEANNFPEDHEEDVRTAIQGCCEQIDRLNKILDGIKLKPKESRWNRSLKVVKSVVFEKQIEAVQRSLFRYLTILGLHANLTISPPTDSTLTTKQATLFDVPSDRDEDFIGRQKILGEINLAFEKEKRIAIYGLGGAGKTQIAIEYCHQYVNANPDHHVLWVPCSSRTRFAQAYRTIARRLNIPGWDNESLDSSALVTEWLNDTNNANWLLILDNADDQEMFYPRKQTAANTAGTAILQYLPKPSSGRVLITSRNKQLSERLAGRATTFAIPELDPDEALQLLLQKLPDQDVDDHGQLRAVAEYLDYLPLALTQAAAFLNETGIGIEEYLDLLKDQNNFIDLLEEDYGDERRDIADGGNSNSVIKTWKISFDRMSTQTPEAAELLCLMSMLDRTGIPQQMLEDLFDKKVEYLTSITALQASSFVKCSAEKKSLSMHRLVQMAVQRWIHQNNESTFWQDGLQRALMIQFNLYGHGFDIIAQPMWDKLYPHAVAALTYSVSPEAESLRAQLQLWTACMENRMGKDNIAHERVLEALSWFQKHRGDDSLLTSKAMGLLARILESKGEFDEATVLQLQIVEQRKKAYGLQCVPSIDSIECLARLYLKQHRYSEAEVTALETVGLAKAAYGEDELRTHSAVLLLSRIYADQERLDEAEELQLMVLSAQRKGHAADTWHIYSTMSDLAQTYLKQRRFEEAEDLNCQVLEYHRKKSQKHNPKLFEALINLVITLWEAGCKNEARELCLEASQQCPEIYGQDHRTTRLMNSLAEIYNVTSSDTLEAPSFPNPPAYTHVTQI